MERQKLGLFIFGGMVGFLIAWALKTCPGVSLLTGRVTDSFGNGLPGVVIAGGGVQGQTGDDGSYRLVLAPGTFDFTFSYPHAVTVYSVTLTLRSGENTHNVVMELYQD